MLAIISAKLNKNVVHTNEKVKIQVKVLVLTPDNTAYRLPMRLGAERGTAKA